MTTPTPKQRLIEAVMEEMEHSFSIDATWEAAFDTGLEKCLKLIEEILE